MELSRKPTEIEKKLLRLLISKSVISFSTDWENDLRVSPMNDGGMGGLYLHPKEALENKRIFGRQISEYQYKDIDGVDVIISLYVDDNDNLYELDIWKTNFNKLINYPSLA